MDFTKHDHSTPVRAPMSPRARVMMPEALDRSPIHELSRRMIFGMLMLLFVTGVTYLERKGYTDTYDGTVSLLDSFYYATVAVTTTGYGDIVPQSDHARLVTAFLVTPVRVLFLVLLVGTSVELIASASRSVLRQTHWRRNVKNHAVLCGFGVKGRAALESLREQGFAGQQVVVIDRGQEAVEAANRAGCVGIVGDATLNDVLSTANVQTAQVVVVVEDRDDTAVLTTLSARSLNPKARIVAAVRELENISLLRQSGADIVISSSGSTGRMLGLAASTPHRALVVEELLEIGTGFDLVERAVNVDEVGPLSNHRREGELVIAVFRDDELIERNPGGDFVLEPGDEVVSIAAGKTSPR